MLCFLMLFLANMKASDVVTDENGLTGRQAEGTTSPEVNPPLQTSKQVPNEGVESKKSEDDIPASSEEKETPIQPKEDPIPASYDDSINNEKSSSNPPKDSIETPTQEAHRIMSAIAYRFRRSLQSIKNEGHKKFQSIVDLSVDKINKRLTNEAEEIIKKFIIDFKSAKRSNDDNLTQPIISKAKNEFIEKANTILINERKVLVDQLALVQNNFNGYVFTCSTKHSEYYKGKISHLNLTDVEKSKIIGELINSPAEVAKQEIAKGIQMPDKRLQTLVLSKATELEQNIKDQLRELMNIAKSAQQEIAEPASNLAKDNLNMSSPSNPDGQKSEVVEEVTNSTDTATNNEEGSLESIDFTVSNEPVQEDGTELKTESVENADDNGLEAGALNSEEYANQHPNISIESQDDIEQDTVIPENPSPPVDIDNQGPIQTDSAGVAASTETANIDVVESSNSTGALSSSSDVPLKKRSNFIVEAYYTGFKQLLELLNLGGTCVEECIASSYNWICNFIGNLLDKVFVDFQGKALIPKLFAIVLLTCIAFSIMSLYWHLIGGNFEHLINVAVSLIALLVVMPFAMPLIMPLITPENVVEAVKLTSSLDGAPDIKI